jgi:hypothetical protein
VPTGWKQNLGLEGAGMRDAKTQEELNILSTYM